MMRKESLENLILIGCIEGKRNGGKQQVTYLTIQSKWMVKQVSQREVITELIVLKTTKEMKLWSAIIAHILKGYGTQFFQKFSSACGWVFIYLGFKALLLTTDHLLLDFISRDNFPPLKYLNQFWTAWLDIVSSHPTF